MQNKKRRMDAGIFRRQQQQNQLQPPRFRGTQRVTIEQRTLENVARCSNYSLAAHIVPDEVAVSSLEMYSEELGAYRQGSTYASISRSETKVDLVKRIDTIDPSYVACAKVTELFDATSQCSWCINALRRGMEYALPDDHPSAKSPPKATAEEAEKIAVKKGIAGRPAPPLTGLVSAAFRHLWKVSELFEPLLDTSNLQAVVSAFFVEKANDPNKLRVIVNALWSNIVYSPKGARFSFFTLETLRQVIHNLVGAKSDRTWYALNFDIRHWFHEIELPRRYASLFAIPLTDRKNKGRFFLKPRAFPMGWTYSPIVAQCLTWALVLSCNQDDRKNHSADADLDIQELQKHRDIFTWVPFKNGGGIFIILDNILVVTPNKATAEYWFEKITSDAERYNIKLKVKPNNKYPDAKLIEGDSQEAKEIRKELLKEQCYFEMKRENDLVALAKKKVGDDAKALVFRADGTVQLKSMNQLGAVVFEFLGITWSHSSFFVATKTGEDLDSPNASLDSKNFDPATGIWTGTRRQLASVVGRLMWYRRCHNRHFFELDSASVTLASIFRRLTPQAGQTWSSQISLESSLGRALADAWSDRAKQLVSIASPLLNTPQRTLWCATDAALNEVARIASCVFYDPFNPTNDNTRYPIRHGALPDHVRTWKYPPNYNIANGELFAIYKALKNIMNGGVRNSLIIIATDSMVAKRWVEAGKAHNDIALELLNKIFFCLKETNNRLYLTYVPSVMNVADFTTKEQKDAVQTHEDYPQLFTTTQKNQTGYLLALAENEAKKVWMLYGGVTGGTNFIAKPSED